VRRYIRQVNHGGTLKYNNRFYIPYEGEQMIIFADKTKLLVTETFNGKLYANYHSAFYKMIEVKTKNSPDKLTPHFDKDKKRICVPSDGRYTNFIFFNKSKENQK